VDVGAQELEAAGLYDPTAPGAAGRLAALEHLVALGATVDEIREAEAGSSLAFLAGELVRNERPRMTTGELAARTGLAPDLIERIWRAGGLPELDRDAPVFTEADVAGFSAFRAGAELVGEDATLQFVRVIGVAMASIADAATATLGLNDDQGLAATTQSELEQVQLIELASVALRDQVPLAVVGFLAHHVDTASRRAALGSDGSLASKTLQLAIGFLDLVGSTALANELAPHELGAVLADFERVTTDAVTRHGGRVVKHIGDEVMFVMADPMAACDVALTLCERYGPAAGTPALRGALAFGPLVRGYGDFYGPLVNLASRMVAVADPGAVVVTDAVRAGSTDASLTFVPLGARTLRGFPDEVDLYAVERAETSESA
jgi:adenylate cyclase